MRNWIRYVGINGIFLAAVVAGFCYGSRGAQNVAMFAAWVSLVGAICWLPSSKLPGSREKVRAHMAQLRPRGLPDWFNPFFDLACVLLLAWHGAFVTAAVYGLHAAFLESLRETPEPAAKKGA